MNDARRFACCCVSVKFPDVGVDLEYAARLLNERLLLTVGDFPRLTAQEPHGDEILPEYRAWHDKWAAAFNRKSKARVALDAALSAGGKHA